MPGARYRPRGDAQQHEPPRLKFVCHARAHEPVVYLHFRAGRTDPASAARITRAAAPPTTAPVIARARLRRYLPGPPLPGDRRTTGSDAASSGQRTCALAVAGCRPGPPQAARRLRHHTATSGANVEARAPGADRQLLGEQMKGALAPLMADDAPETVDGERNSCAAGWSSDAA